ncbi:hypothetical protein BS78_09G207500 [Paspalum vaginatum]|nr:hypothetical protein BS78_09G207500 [Paspalum vaginatum]
MRRENNTRCARRLRSRGTAQWVSSARGSRRQSARWLLAQKFSGKGFLFGGRGQRQPGLSPFPLSSVHCPLAAASVKLPLQLPLPVPAATTTTRPSLALLLLPWRYASVFTLPGSARPLAFWPLCSSVPYVSWAWLRATSVKRLLSRSLLLLLFQFLYLGGRRTTPRHATMGRAMRWLKKVLTGGGAKEGERGRKEHTAACAGGRLGLGPPPVEKRRWSFAKPRSSAADGGRSSSVAAGELLSQVRPCSCGQEREVDAAVVIQKAFRGYLARKALRALKSLVKLQALVRGYLVRKQAATTLRRLQALMRLQAKTAASRKSTEQQERIVARVKPLALPVVHRRRLSDGGDTGLDRSPKIVEMDTCHFRCRSSRITSRYAADRPAGASSPLLFFHKPASRLQGQELELEPPPPPHPNTTHNTPRLGAFLGYLGSPAKAGPRAATCRDAGSSPRYMADTASSVARTRCQSAPRQRQGEPRPSVGHIGPRKKQLQPLDSFSFKSSEASRVDSELSDEVTRDYYLDRLW